MTGKFELPVATNLPRNFIESLAAKAAGKLGYKSGDNIFETAESLGGRIRMGSIGDLDKQSGSLIAKSLSNWTIYLSPIAIPARDRFAIAHNIGHLLLHLPQCKKRNAQGIMRAGRYPPGGEIACKKVDWEANWFAFAFLMPAGDFKKLFEKAGKATCCLHFGVSGLLVRARAQSLGFGQFL